MSGDIFLSIDFEDFSHDLKRHLGLSESPPVRIDALWKSYEKIQSFLTAHGSRNVTFFCTGILAENAPELIAKIAKDGHEIACHYYLHDNMRLQSPSTVKYFAEKAKDALESVSGAEVLGFRAPRFSIDTNSPPQYQILAKIFRYDSSWYGRSVAHAKKFLHEMGTFEEIKLFPIFSAKPYLLSPALRLGGSYLKLFPLAVAKRLHFKCVEEGIVPHIYLHPYEFVSDNSFALLRSELAQMGYLRSHYWMLRQHQWNTIGNATLPKKLSELINGSRILGKLSDNLAHAI